LPPSTINANKIQSDVNAFTVENAAQIINFDAGGSNTSNLTVNTFRLPVVESSNRGKFTVPLEL
jgi:hypothetical protein